MPWVDPAKLQPPAPPPVFLDRRVPLPAAPVALVEGGAGAGKSQLLAAWAAGGTPALWYGADVDDADAEAFFHGLIAAVRRGIPGFGAEQDPQAPPRQAWQRLFAELAGFNAVGGVLVVDDLHLAPEAVRLALGELLDRTPAEMRLLLGSRGRPFPLEKAEAAGRLAVVAPGFDAAEQAAFLALAAPGADPEAFKELEGWPLGLALAAAGGPGAPKRVGAYLADEVFAGLPAEEQDALVKAALVPPAAWGAVFGSDAGLAPLAARGVLAKTADGGLRVPAYWRAWLEGEAARRFSAEERAAWQQILRPALDGRGSAPAVGWVGQQETTPGAHPPPAYRPPPPLPTAPRPHPGGRTLSLRCFGPFECVVNGRSVGTWSRRKATLILAALALEPKGLPSYMLGELLAGDGDASPNVLKVTIHALRRSLEPTLGPHATSAFVLHEDDRYKLAPGVALDADVRTFQAALDAADRLRDPDPAQAAARYAEGLALYRGELLEGGFYIPYFEAEREGLRRRAIAAMAWLAERDRARMDDAGADRWLRRAVAAAPHEEAPYIQLMQLHALGRRVDKVQLAYWDARKAIKTYLGLTPSAELEAAYRQAMATF